MALAIKIIGIIITLLGLLILISPATGRLWIKSWSAGKLPALGVLISFLMGIFLIFFASECTIAWIPSFIGILSIVKGLVLLAYGPKRLIMKASIWLEPRMTLVRFSSLSPIILGIMLVIAA